MEQAFDIRFPGADGARANDGDIRRYSRVEAAQCQLEMAVRALLQFDDPVSALTLAGAAERVLSDLQPKDGILGVDAWSIRSFCNTYIKKAHQKDAADLLRASYNRLKHAEHDKTETHEIHEAAVLIWLLLSIRAFTSLGGSASPVLNAFKLWAMAARPEWISENDPALVKAFSEASGKLKQLPKAEAFAALLEFVSSKSLIPNPKSLQEQTQP